MLDVLPPELLTSIMGHTTTADQLNTSLVCRRVQSVISTTRTIKKRPDEIRISARLLHPVSYQIGKIRFDHAEQDKKLAKLKRRLHVTLSKKDKGGRDAVMDTMDGDVVEEDSLPSTSTDLPQLKEILSKCIHGTSLIFRSLPITTAFLSTLSTASTEIGRVTAVVFDLCVFADQEELLATLRAFLSKTSVQCLTMEFCREEGERRIICDELFTDLHYLKQLFIQERMPGTNGITKKMVDRWIDTTVPYMVNFRNVESALDAESVRKIIEFTLRTQRKFKTVWNLGTIRHSDNRDLTSLLLMNHRELTIATHIDMIGQRHFKITHPWLDMAFAITGC